MSGLTIDYIDGQNVIRSVDQNNLFDFRSASSVRRVKRADIPYGFYSMVGSRYNLAYRELRRARQWASGNVPGVHSKLLSSMIYHNINNRMTNLTMDGGLVFDSEDSSLGFFKTLFNELDIKTVANESIYGMNEGGFSDIKLDIVKSKPSISVLDADQTFKTVKNGEIVEHYSILDYITTTAGEKPDIYLVENRYYDKEGIPTSVAYFVRLDAKNDNPGSNLFYRKDRIKGVGVVNDILRQFDLSEVEVKAIKSLMKPRRLPFKDLGVSTVQLDEKHPLYFRSHFSPSNYTKIGDDLLINYEILASIQSHEVATSPKMIAVPQDMSTADSDNNSFISNSKQLNGTYFLKMPYVDDESNADPKEIEFSIRSEDIIKMTSQAVESISFALGIDKRDLMDIRSGSQHQTPSKFNKTIMTVNSQRDAFTRAIKKIIDNILYLYDIECDSFNVIWTGTNLEDLERKVGISVKRHSANLSSIEEEVRFLNPNKTEKQIQEEVDKIKALRVEQQTSNNSNQTGVNTHYPSKTP